MSACVIAPCTIRGQHLDDCAGHCSGCLPAQATHGLACDHHARRILGHLGALEDPRDDTAPHGLPWAWEHLADFVEPTTRPGDHRGSPEPPAPISLAVIDLRDEIRDWLGATTADLMARTGLHGPDGVRLSTDWRDRHVGRPWLIVRRCAEWLAAHADSLLSGAGIADLEAAGEAVRALEAEAGSLMSRAHALAPWRPAPTLLDGIPCRCGALALHDHTEEIICAYCGAHYTREQYRWLCRVLADLLAAG